MFANITSLYKGVHKHYIFIKGCSQILHLYIRVFTNITSLYKGLFFKCPALCTNRKVQDELIFVVSLNNNPFLSFSNYLLGFSIKKRLYTILYKAFYILWSDPVLSVPVDLPISWASGRIARWSEACIQFCFLRGQSPPHAF